MREKQRTSIWPNGIGRTESLWQVNQSSRRMFAIMGMELKCVSVRTHGVDTMREPVWILCAEA